MNNYLLQIIDKKKEHLKYVKTKSPLKDLIHKIEDLPFQPKNFKEAISKPGKLNLIAELKKASPSKGQLIKNFNVKKISKIYEQCGASAISVLTEEHAFKGKLSNISLVKNTTSLPILRKDFIIDEYQIYESRLIGADAVLIIASILSKQQILDLVSLTNYLHLQTLLEIHDESEIEKINSVETDIIGINNRNLQDFSVDLRNTLKLLPLIPPKKVIVSESGIRTKEDIKLLKNTPVNAVLIGEALIKEKNIAKKIKDLFEW